MVGKSESLPMMMPTNGAVERADRDGGTFDLLLMYDP
jgi:hypothetical protein